MEEEINHKLQREPPNVTLQGGLMGHRLAGSHTMQPVVLGTPKVGPNSIFVRIGSQPKGGVLAKGDGPLGSPNVALQGGLTRRRLAGGHTMQLVVLGTLKVGPNSMLVRAGSQPKGGVLAKEDGPLGSSKSQSSILLAKGQDCGPNDSNF